VTGVWIGFDSPKKIKGNAQGGVLAAPAWTAMMKEIYDRRPIPPAWTRPAGLTALDIDNTTGYKSTPFCPKGLHYIESFIPAGAAQFCPCIPVQPGQRASPMVALRRRRRALRPARHVGSLGGTRPQGSPVSPHRTAIRWGHGRRGRRRRRPIPS
jgi:membrane peptidoglycan carboxypeptidase